MKGGSHSAEVRMQLLMNDRALRIGQLGPNFIILDDPTGLPPGEAEIWISVDGSESRWPVWLLNGISADEPRAEISGLPGTQFRHLTHGPGGIA